MIAAIDIGGTKTLIAVFDEDGKVVEQTKFATPPEYTNFVIELKKQVNTLSTKVFKAGAIGIRGNIDREKGLAVLDDVLAWREAPVRDDCSKIFACPFVLENDSKVAGFSEAKQVRSEFAKVLYITISTGIGSAFVVNGTLETATINSEIGKSIFEHEGKYQSWEDFAGGKAIVEKYGKRASEINDPAIWKAISMNLAPGIIDAVAAYTPDIIILGGGVGAHFDKFKQPLSDAIRSILPAELKEPIIRQAKHPEEAVIYGCYELAKQNLKSV